MEKELNLKKGSIFIYESIEEDLNRIYDHYRKVVNENQYLRTENERLKSETYKDEELSKMKEQYEKMKSDYYRGFPISKKQEEKISKWIDKLPQVNKGAIGGRFHYHFFPTSIGTMGKIIDGVTNQEFIFQDFI